MPKRKGDQRYDYTANKKRLTSASVAPPSNIGVQSALRLIETLGAPFGYNSGSRVPDFLSVPTCTMKLELEITETISADAGGNMQVGGSLVLNSAGIRYSTINAPGGSINIIAPTYPGAGNNVWDKATNTNMPGYFSLMSNASALRITGAGINVEFTGNDTINGGLILTSSKTSLDVAKDASYAFPTVSSMENYRNNYNGPLKEGCLLRWIPLDGDDWNFGVTPSGATLTYGQAEIGTSRESYDNPNANANNYRNFGSLQWFTQGAQLAASFRINIAVHVEYIPLTTLGTLGEESTSVSLPSILNICGALSNITTGVQGQTAQEQQTLSHILQTLAGMSTHAQTDSQHMFIQDLVAKAISMGGPMLAAFAQKIMFGNAGSSARTRGF